MLSLRYHRQYLWIFFTLCLFLMCSSLYMDCYYVATDSGTTTGTFSLRTPRFINVVSVLLFSAISAVVQHYLSRFICSPDLLFGDRRKWLSKNIKIKEKQANPRKKTKKRKYVQLTFSFMLSNLLAYIPIIILFSLWVAKVNGIDGKMTFTEWNKRTVFAPEFFIPALFIKYVAWYINSLFSYCRLFRQNKRRNFLINKQVNI